MQTEDLIEHPSKPGRGPYRRRSLTEKRGIVQLCLQPGASVAGVALAHGANANLVRKWIAKYRSGQWGEETGATAAAGRCLATPCAGRGQDSRR